VLNDFYCSSLLLPPWQVRKHFTSPTPTPIILYYSLVVYLSTTFTTSANITTCRFIIIYELPTQYTVTSCRFVRLTTGIKTILHSGVACRLAQNIIFRPRPLDVRPVISKMNSKICCHNHYYRIIRSNFSSACITIMREICIMTMDFIAAQRYNNLETYDFDFSLTRMILFLQFTVYTPLYSEQRH